MTSDPTTTLVWELDTAVHNTFTVHTDTHDLLVHNQDGPMVGCTNSSPRRANAS